ncbi:hypothetical protein ACFLTO_00355 [Chloroflexota bacterium]
MSKEEFWRSYNWRFNDFLYVPGFQHAPEPTNVDTILQNTTGTAITHEEIFGRVITQEELFELVGSISCTNWLLFFSKIATALSDKNRLGSEFQYNLARMVFPDDLIDKVGELTGGDFNGIPINIWQIITLAKIALLESELTAENSNELGENRELVAHCLLGINDYIGSRDFDSRYGETADDKYHELLEALIRQISCQISEAPKNVLSRYYEILLKLPSSPQSNLMTNHVVIKDLFEDLFHFPLELYFYLSFGVYSQYLIAWKDGTPPNNENVLIDKNTYFSKTKVPKEQYESFLESITISKQEYISEHRKKYAESFGMLNDFNIIRNKPLIALNKNKSLTVNTPWLYQKLGEGLFWMISDRLGRGANENFREFFGQLYHLYFTNIIKRIFPDSLLQPRAFYDVSYGDEKRSSDAIVYYPGKLVLFEAKWPTVRMDQTAIPGDLEAYNFDVDNIIIHAARQLDRNINDLISGELNLEGVDITGINEFYPIIVTARPFPMGLLLTSYILDKVKDSGLLSLPNIKRLEIISIEELEVLEPIITKGKTFPEIINRKHGSIYSDLPLLWHIYKNEIEGTTVPNNEYIDELFAELTENIRRDLFKDSTE